MSDQRQDEDPIERASRIFAELRNKQEGATQPGAAPETPPTPPSPPTPPTPPTVAQPNAAAESDAGADAVGAERLEELARLVGQRLQEVAQREARLAAMERQLDERLRSVDKLPDAVRHAAPGNATETNLALRARLEALERRLAELDRRERGVANLPPPPATPAGPSGPAGGSTTPRRISARPSAVANGHVAAGDLASGSVAASEAPAARLSAPTVAVPAAPLAGDALPTTVSTPPSSAVSAPLSPPSSAPPPPSGPAGPNRQLLLWLALPLVLLVAIVAIVVINGARGEAPRAAGVVTNAATSSAAAPDTAVATTATTVSAAVPTSSQAASTTAESNGSVANTASAATSAHATTGAAPVVIAPGAPAPAATALRLLSTLTVGNGLCDLTAAAAGNRLYLADDGTEQILVYDPAAHQQIASFGMRESLCSIAVDDAGHTIYAPTWARNGSGGYTSSEIQSIDLNTGQTRIYADAAFPSGPFFDAVAHRLYVGNTAQPTVTVIDPASADVTTWNVGVKVNRIARSSISGHLYMASPDDNRVVVVDPATGKVLSTLSVGQRPWDVVADPKSGNVLVSSELSGMVALIDPRTDQVKQTIPTGDHPRAVAVDGERGHFYVLNVASRTVSTIRTDGTLVKTSDPLPGKEELTGLAVDTATGQVIVLAKTHLYVLG